MILSGRTSLLALIDAEKLRQGLSDAELLRRAGLAPNVLTNFRKNTRRGLMFNTTLALINALGLVLSAAPE